jgi:predicted transglutaminase-like cysteine proteinase
MTRLTAVGAALTTALLLSGAGPAAADAPLSLNNSGTAHAAEFGASRPPIGFVRFCVTNPADCGATQRKPERLALNPDRWNTLHQVNTYVNNKILPMSDQELYGEPERWAIPTDAGDCEDYLLLKKQYLEKLGFPPSALLITVVLDENNEGHAVLMVAGEDGDYILDNRRNDILRWHDTSYVFLKRQSQENARRWVALVKENTVAQGQLSASNSR